MDFCKDPRTRTFRDTIFAIYRYPFIDDDTEEEDRYIQNSFSILRDENRLRAHGLAAAYLYQTVGISFCSAPFWDALRFVLQIEGKEENCVEILSVSKPEHFEEQVFLEWKENNTEIQLVECSIPITDKCISLRDDHGKDVLQQFAERLIYSSYIVAVINSLPYNSNETNFIRKVKPDGIIEIVLTNTDKGLGLVAKTTGRNYKETEAIAKILREKFDDSQ
jgi:hypothetical protein